jgi:hypothetical protein
MRLGIVEYEIAQKIHAMLMTDVARPLLEEGVDSQVALYLPTSGCLEDDSCK